MPTNALSKAFLSLLTVQRVEESQQTQERLSNCDRQNATELLFPLPLKRSSDRMRVRFDCLQKLSKGCKLFEMTFDSFQLELLSV